MPKNGKKKEKKATDNITLSHKLSIKKEMFIKEFPGCAYNICETCKKIGINRRTYYDWMENDPEFKAAYEDYQEDLIDWVETQFMKNVKKGKEASQIFFMKTKGAKRGYLEKKIITGDLTLKMYGKDAPVEDV